MKINKSELLHLLGHAQASLRLLGRFKSRAPTPKHELLLERLTEHVTEGGQISIIDNCPHIDHSIHAVEPSDDTVPIEGGL